MGATPPPAPSALWALPALCAPTRQPQGFALSAFGASPALRADRGGFAAGIYLGIRCTVPALRSVMRFLMPPKSSLAVEGFLQAFVGLFSIIRLVYSLLVVFLRLGRQFTAEWGGLMRLRAFRGRFRKRIATYGKPLAVLKYVMCITYRVSDA